jgi:hypothetical protein
MVTAKGFDRSAEPFLASLMARRREAKAMLADAEAAGRKSEAAALRKHVADFEKMIRRKGGVIED